MNAGSEFIILPDSFYNSGTFTVSDSDISSDDTVVAFPTNSRYSMINIYFDCTPGRGSMSVYFQGLLLGDISSSIEYDFTYIILKS